MIDQLGGTNTHSLMAEKRKEERSTILWNVLDLKQKLFPTQGKKQMGCSIMIILRWDKKIHISLMHKQIAVYYYKVEDLQKLQKAYPP